jgi:hypothetical protein
MEEQKFVAHKIMDFADKYLDGNIDLIASFPLGRLWNDPQFGCPESRRYDNDDTELMRCIYVLIFSDVWPGLSLNSLGQYEYRGETMNTYNTLFGQPPFPYKSESMTPGLDKFPCVPSELRAKAADFRFNTYGRIGNMVVLPNRQLDCISTESTINKYRGCHHVWHDFFDLFLNAFRIALVYNKYEYQRFQELIELNSDYLAPFRSETGFNHLVSGLFFDDYIGTDGEPKILSKGYFHWMKDVAPEDYFSEASRYLDFASEVINNRSIKMAEAIKIKISQI